MAVVVTLVLIGGLAGAGAYVYTTFEPQISAILSADTSEDYSGDGSGEVTVQISDGDFGEAIGTKLQAAGVIKDSKTFYRTLLKKDPQPVFQTGTFKLASKMSSTSAIAALLNPANKVDYTVSIPEGTTASGIYESLASVTGMSFDDFKAAGADFVSLGVPANAPSVEGFLYPATYEFQPGQTPSEMLKTMVDRQYEALDAAGVAVDQRLQVLTLAALIQGEAGSVEDMYKVSRVFQNRLADGMNLQSDATVRYGAGGSAVDTTEAEREDASNLYNTYANPGLPVGPIGNPGSEAIDAALHPADGAWLYFVTVNLDTGETIFSDTYDGQLEAVKQYQANHPEG
ncbi:Endolytic murein transglycosylase [Agreia sp. COWG]|nr:Endolytic murein transglycosylase [Agreia sp. COWG]